MTPHWPVYILAALLVGFLTGNAARAVGRDPAASIAAGVTGAAIGFAVLLLFHSRIGF